MQNLILLGAEYAPRITPLMIRLLGHPEPNVFTCFCHASHVEAEMTPNGHKDLSRRPPGPGIRMQESFLRLLSGLSNGRSPQLRYMDQLS